MHARNKPERFPFQSGCKSTHFTRNIQTLYDLFWDFFNTQTANNWKTADYTNKKTTNENITGIWNTPLFNILIQIKKLQPFIFCLLP